MNYLSVQCLICGAFALFTPFLGVAPAFSQAQTPPIGAPRSTIGGTRGACQGAIVQADGELTLTALVPQNNILYTYGRTPNLYVYLPTIAGKQAFIRVIDLATEEVLFQSQPFTLNKQSAIAQLVFPETLRLNTKSRQPDTLPYQWDLFVQCDPRDPEQDVTIGGWIWPLEAEATDPETAWIEQIDQAFQLWPDNPQIWRDRLLAAGLEEFATVSLTTLELMP